MNTLIKSEFPLLRRLSRDLDWVFDRLTTEKPLFEGELPAWMPDIEVFERGSEIVVKADVPGLTREEIAVDIADQTLTIRGERKREKEEKKGEVYRSERTYGSFVRSVTLPEGAKLDQATATVKDGVLEVKMPIARIESKTRRLEIKDGATGEKAAKHAA
jgi:HSP20 family protein